MHNNSLGFIGPFAKSCQNRENANLFVNLLETMIETCLGEADDLELRSPYNMNTSATSSSQNTILCAPLPLSGSNGFVASPGGAPMPLAGSVSFAAYHQSFYADAVVVHGSLFYMPFSITYTYYLVPD